METTEMKGRGPSNWSRRGKVVITLMVSALCVEAAMAYQQIAYDANPCKINDTLFNSQDGGCKDLRTGRVWSRNSLSPERGGTFGTFGGAQYICGNKVEGGYDDWRMPTRDELKTVAANGASTHLDVFWAVDGSGGPATEYDFNKWSSTTVMVKSPGYRKGQYAYVVALGGSGYDTYQWWSTGSGSWTDVVCVR